jgi:hypothetical protein
MYVFSIFDQKQVKTPLGYTGGCKKTQNSEYESVGFY